MFFAKHFIAKCGTKSSKQLMCINLLFIGTRWTSSPDPTTHCSPLCCLSIGHNVESGAVRSVSSHLFSYSASLWLALSRHLAWSTTRSPEMPLSGSIEDICSTRKPCEWPEGSHSDSLCQLTGTASGLWLFETTGHCCLAFDLLFSSLRNFRSRTVEFISYPRKSILQVGVIWNLR